MKNLEDDSLRLKAAIEFGSDYIYTIKNGGHGPTLVIHAETKALASIVRLKAPNNWEGLYVLVTYNTASPDEPLYDPSLT